MTEEATREILADLFDVAPDGIDERFTSDSVELWDSLAQLRLVTALEERFGVTLTMSEIGEMNGYGAILRILHGHLDGR